ncbi:MAG: NAD-binding protein [Anaerolineae bacterium]|nr:NAD-binding protein [Anaerolineae bacterium]
MRVVIIGGGKVGSTLARTLLKDNYEVCLIEHRPQVLSRLHKELPTEVILDGDGTRMQTLEYADIANCDVLATLTGDDKVNLMVALLAKETYQVQRVIARINHPDNAWLFTPEMGVDIALNQADLLTQLIAEKLSLGDMMTLMRLKQGDLTLINRVVEPGADGEGKTVSELELPRDCLLLALVRHDEIIIPRGNTVLEARDEVLALARGMCQKVIDDIFSLQNANKD